MTVLYLFYILLQMFTHKNGYDLESCGGAFCSGTCLVLFGQDLHVFSMRFALPSRQGKKNSATKWHYDAIFE